MKENGSWSRVSDGYATGQNKIQVKFLNFNLNSILSCNRYKREFIYIGHVCCCCPNAMLTKKMLFAKPRQHTKGTPGSVKWYLKSAEDLYLTSIEQHVSESWFRCFA